MKKLTGLSAVTAAVVILATGGLASAAEKQDLSFLSSTGSWQFEGSVETGRLPGGENLSKAQTGNSNGFAEAEHGGVVYRVGIDTQ